MPSFLKLAMLLNFAFIQFCSAERVDFTRNAECVKSTYLCGQCESVAEVSTFKLLRDFIGKTVPMTEVLRALVKSVELKMDYPFVPILMGNSPSLMSANATHPKVILKSPESEFLIAYNTDPKSEAFESIETIRFEGKTADFKFEQVIRDAAGRIQVKQNPVACLKCHGSDPHPLWDTYRAWPGVFGARDDLIEKGSSEVEPFFELLKKKDQRLEFLHLPSASAIHNDLAAKAWFRIPHLPSTFHLKSRSLRTAEFAGPSHLLFDQLSGELGCFMMKRIQNTLTASEFEKVEKVLDGWVPGERIQSSDALIQQEPVFTQMQRIQKANAIDQQLKVKRQVTWLKSLGASQEEAWEESFFVKQPFLPKWFAVPDPGGVLGVPETDLPFLAYLESLLASHQESLSHWSMSVGPVVDSQFKSYSFSDQLVRSLQSVILNEPK